MPDSSRFVAHSGRADALQSRSYWSLEIGRLRLAVTRAHEVRASATADRPAQVARRGRPFTAGALAGVGAVALVVVGASAATRPAEPSGYVVSLAVPDRAPVSLVRPAHRKPAVGRVARRSAAAPGPLTASGERFDVADEPYVSRAMATGAFQEWEDAAGQRRFLTAGPVRATGGRWCRDMALLVRLAEGGSRVRSAERCAAAPISDAAPSPEPAAAAAED